MSGRIEKKEEKEREGKNLSSISESVTRVVSGRIRIEVVVSTGKETEQWVSCRKVKKGRSTRRVESTHEACEESKGQYLETERRPMKSKTRTSEAAWLQQHTSKDPKRRASKVDLRRR